MQDVNSLKCEITMEPSGSNVKCEITMGLCDSSVKCRMTMEPPSSSAKCEMNLDELQWKLLAFNKCFYFNLIDP